MLVRKAFTAALALSCALAHAQSTTITTEELKNSGAAAVSAELDAEVRQNLETFNANFHASSAKDQRNTVIELYDGLAKLEQEIDRQLRISQNSQIVPETDSRVVVNKRIMYAGCAAIVGGIVIGYGTLLAKHWLIGTLAQHYAEYGKWGRGNSKFVRFVSRTLAAYGPKIGIGTVIVGAAVWLRGAFLNVERQEVVLTAEEATTLLAELRTNHAELQTLKLKYEALFNATAE